MILASSARTRASSPPSSWTRKYSNSVVAVPSVRDLTTLNHAFFSFTFASLKYLRKFFNSSRRLSASMALIRGAVDLIFC